MDDRVQRLRRDLAEAIAPPTCPTGYRMRTFSADDAPAVHRLLEVGYAQGGGRVGPFEEWWPSLRDDDEFSPDLCFLALNERRDIVGVAQCWTSAFIKDLVVHPLARRRGIATALLGRVFWEFRRRGAKHVDLKVQVDNPAGTDRLYKKMGMRDVPLDGTVPSAELGPEKDAGQKSAYELFLGTADDYDRYRPPYPQKVFDWVIAEYKLDGRGRLLDVGCGTGQVALRLSQWFTQVIAIDPEHRMLQIGERNAREQNIANVRFLRMRAEDVSNEMSPLRLVTFGASFHWVDRVVVAGRMYEMLEPGGGLVILAPSGIWGGAEPWQEVVVKTIKDWLGEDRRAGSGTYKTAPLHQECLAQTPFSDLTMVDIHHPHVWSADSLIGYLHSTSFASKAVLGHLAEPFEKDLRNRLANLGSDDRFSEQIEFTIISGRKPR